MNLDTLILFASDMERTLTAQKLEGAARTYGAIATSLRELRGARQKLKEFEVPKDIAITVPGGRE